MLINNDMEPTTLTAAAIATLAFREFIKSGAGELAKKFTAGAIIKMKELRDLIWNKLRSDPNAVSALASVADGSEEELNDVTTYLKAAMKNDPQFAAQVQTIAQEINAGKLQDNSSMVQNNYDRAIGFQNKVEGGTAYIGIHHYGKSRDPEQK